jgi:hypothetical protein
MDAQIIAAIITTVGALLAVILGYFLTKKKTDAVVKRSKLKEIILYDGTKGISSLDISSEYSRYDIENGVIVIRSEDDEFSRIKLKTYHVDGKERTFIPKNELVSGYRKFRANCELKVIGASYDVAVYLWETPESEEDPSVDDRSVVVNDNEWTKAEFNFRAPPDRNYAVNINAEKLSGSGGLQIRNLLVVEQVS